MFTFVSRTANLVGGRNGPRTQGPFRPHPDACLVVEDAGFVGLRGGHMPCGMPLAKRPQVYI
jgi:hypothetical protein